MAKFGKIEIVHFMAENLPYTGTLVRQHDPDRFFMTLLQPAAVRPALWVLLAFHYEVAKTREVVSEPTLGYMRLQWWREALEKLYAGHPAPTHEILQPLSFTIKQYGLPFSLFDELITSRELDLDGTVPADLPALKDYASHTTVPLTKLLLLVCGQNADGVEKISCAYGLAGIMRAIPFMAQLGRTLVPQSMACIDEMFRDELKCQEVLTILHNESAQLLVDAGSLSSKWLRLMGDATRLMLQHMERLQYDVRDQRYSETPPFFHLRLLLKI